MIRGTHFAEDLDSLADGIVARYGEPGLTTGPHPRSPAVAERLGYLRGLRQAAEMVRDSIVKDGGDWKQHAEHFGKEAT
tara:strand:- start:2142 stop:2378 length:237 start_codon:yes stop_codon:yes gene_type:complete